MDVWDRCLPQLKANLRTVLRFGTLASEPFHERHLIRTSGNGLRAATDNEKKVLAILCHDLVQWVFHQTLQLSPWTLARGYIHGCTISIPEANLPTYEEVSRFGSAPQADLIALGVRFVWSQLSVGESPTSVPFETISPESQQELLQGLQQSAAVFGTLPSWAISDLSHRAKTRTKWLWDNANSKFGGTGYMTEAAKLWNIDEEYWTAFKTANGLEDHSQKWPLLWLTELQRQAVKYGGSSDDIWNTWDDSVSSLTITQASTAPSGSSGTTPTGIDPTGSGQ